jgi:tRNA pseudouridine38-40 synthase
MRNIVLEIAYDGSRYAGLQVQNNAVTVQGVIETGLQKILHRFERIKYAGRTDAGVHALGQVVSFCTENNMTPEQFTKALNSIIPADIRIHRSYEAPDSFHPRYSAKKRWYRYIISTSKAPVPFFRNYVLWVDRDIDIDLLNHYAECILGSHDFSSFARCEPGDVPNREVYECLARRRGDFITLDIVANSFLRKMVRAIVGTFLELERYSEPPERVTEILASANRSAAGKTVFPGGLYLVKVFY